jgi:hypothetical protein
MSVSPIPSPAFTPQQVSKKSTKQQQRFVPDVFHMERLVGLKFFSIRNRYGCYVVPSALNFLAGHQFPKLKVDEQANRTLLPLFSSEMLEEILQKYGSSKTEYSLSIAKFRTRLSPVLALTLKAKNKRAHLSLSIGADVYPESLVEGGSFLISSLARSDSSCATDSSDQSGTPRQHLTPGGKTFAGANTPAARCTFKLPRVDFFLCSEDVNHLLTNAERLSLSSALVDYRADLDTLQSFAKTCKVNVPRRSDGVIGNTVMRRYSTVKHMNVEFVFNTSQNFLEDLTWQILEETALLIHKYGYLQAPADHGRGTMAENIASAVKAVDGRTVDEELAEAIGATTDDESLDELWPNDIVFDADQTTGLYANITTAVPGSQRASFLAK